MDPAEIRRLAEREILSGEAEQARRRLGALDPQADPEADFLLALAEQRLGELAAARERLVRLRRRIPTPSARLESLLAKILILLGEGAEARAALERATQIAPGDAQLWSALGHLYGEHALREQAHEAFERAAAIDPGSADIAALRVLAKQEIGDDRGAMEVVARAARGHPQDLRIRVAERLYLPQVYGSVEEIERWRSRYRGGLEALTRETAQWAARASQVFRLEWSNFFLAYQGEDDRALQEGYSRFIAALAHAAAPELCEPLPVRRPARPRLRVGFLGNVFHDCTAGRYFERWITGLEARRFERFVYHTAPGKDEVTERIAAASEHFIDEGLDALGAARLVRSHELDVLVYPEVGMSALTYLLAALRLAPVQCAAWGHPVTTGSAQIDEYFTCEPMEPPGAERHYTERLVRLPGIGVSYAMPQVEAAPDRSRWGLPARARLDVCAQSLFKVHPEMDDVFAGILSADRDGVLLLFQAPVRAVTERLAGRLERALARHGLPPRGQVKFLPRLSGGQFRQVLASADVVLDTFRWSGGNTTLDALAVGAPVVTTPGELMRGRQTSAMLELIGLPQLVAKDAGEYVRLALGTASDAEANARLRREILERRALLFDRGDWLAPFADALERAARGDG
jgi:CRISPR-associated protein Csy1